ncbi:hypothetical protein GOP47_0024264 [Adiantum capillus-veneris]|uniref:F-box domain-containing protein n=1 Tax=Adiantum capillus-veneris TaxID=13818 RepID=A0A9D4U523_ADICA|nr:hypothetical protein GOP47_0024264 [Adiantum capillus-veneris]
MHAHSEARDGLIGWLPEELVLFHVLPRLPWYTRPVCRAVSKSWRALIDACKTMGAAELELKTRQYQLPLLRGLFLICTSDTQVFITRQRVGDERKGATYHTVEQLSDPFEREWGKFDNFLMHRQFRSLPPLGHTLPSCCDVEARLLASSGRVYVWFDYERPDFVLKMDMGCGDWTWNKIAVPHPFCSDAIDFNGKIYMPLLLTEGSDFVQDSASQEEKEAVLVFDTMTDRWKHV